MCTWYRVGKNASACRGWTFPEPLSNRWTNPSNRSPALEPFTGYQLNRISPRYKSRSNSDQFNNGRNSRSRRETICCFRPRRPQTGPTDRERPFSCWVERPLFEGHQNSRFQPMATPSQVVNATLTNSSMAETCANISKLSKCCLQKYSPGPFYNPQTKGISEVLSALKQNSVC